ncbi:hypothetical protein [Erythrobacter sp. Alg231-14]|uniref:hypothetical protein n=1 Tax=Erythrobacter sp. Alg231-14 TaxID=1922225 RepID=UPI000D5564F6
MLLRKVEKFMSDHNMPATKFGRLAAHDPRFVLDLRMGRIPRPATEARIKRWMAHYIASYGASSDDVLSTNSASISPTIGSLQSEEFSHAV